MKNLKVIGLCFVMCISFIQIDQVKAESVTTDDGLYSIDRSNGRIMAYNPSGLANAPTEVVIPDTLVVNGKSISVKEIGNSAFNSDDKVTKVVIADSITKMNNAFSECPDLREIVLGSGISELRFIIGEYLPSITSFTIPGTVKILSGTLPFDGCDNLTEMIFEEGFESIPTADIDVIGGMSTLQRVVFPSTLKTIHANAFNSNDGITDIIIAQDKATSPLGADEPWGARNATVTWTSGGGTTNLTTSQDVKVYYDPSNKISDVNNPADAQWSVVIPKAISFTQQPNGKSMQADITLKSENGSALPSGKNAVHVSVASKNGFQLNYNSENVPYELRYSDGFGKAGALNDANGTTKALIGTLQDGNTTITSTAEVKAPATTVAIYSDTLTYSIEKVTLP